MVENGTKVTWNWYQLWMVQDNGDGTEWWKVHNLKTRITVSCTSESASLKIIELAYALRMGEPKPLNHSTLERKAKELEGFGHPSIDRYHTWDGEERFYKELHEKRYDRYLKRVSTKK